MAELQLVGGCFLGRRQPLAAARVLPLNEELLELRCFRELVLV
ncbi:hypothetical protein BN2497_5373 [Janthinobacterium sp. CG23_2]|nr:hypothetical protein BN2497_5373 [Janthinobacterium sp. CG23_2]CUU29084.1 hypothetical protein BN3177_5373 [Janthinobacterium sp. CG23_2]